MKRFELKITPRQNIISTTVNGGFDQVLVESPTGKLMLYADYENEITRFKKQCIREMNAILNTIGDDDE